MYKSKLSKVIVALLRRIAGVTRSGANRLMRAMLRSLMAMGRRANLPVAGFVLPTVTMVLLVVILLTIAITLRSFDRANTARNVRVNQQVLAAATPAIDRAKAKIQYLLEQTQDRGTPSDAELYFPIANPTTTGSTARDSYTFGDEERLRLKYDLNDDNSISEKDVNKSGFVIEENESINTAWRYPVDTNNDGKFDNFTIYGIFFRTPPRDPNKGPTLGDFTRKRKPLEARMPPQRKLKAGCEQGGGTVASLAGDSGWYRIDGKLKKSFFVYTVNVPMTAADVAAAADPKYQAFTGTPSISALEYQQDQAIIPIANNAVAYEDDLDISPGPPLNLNGRVFTNSNLLVTGFNDPNSVKMYQVSSPDSCYYDQEGSKIVVAGNVVNGWSGNNTIKRPVDVHLFKEKSLPTAGRSNFMLVDKKLEIKKTTGESAENPSLDVAYNNEAYTKRLNLLVEAQMGEPLPPTNLANPDPQPNDPFSVRNKPATQSRKEALTEYFKQMLRKVPFAEVPLDGDATAGYGLSWSKPPATPPIKGDKDTLRPIDEWSLLNPDITKIKPEPDRLEATNPSKEPEEEIFLGDRVVVGNNLPAKRWDNTKQEFTKQPEVVAGGKWNSGDNSPRTRSSQVTKLADTGATARDGFWEQEAARVPKNPLDGNGGLRVITSGGVYDRTNSFLPPPSWQALKVDGTFGTKSGPVSITTPFAPENTYDDPATPATEQYPVVWPDSMPMSPLGPGSQVYDNTTGDPDPNNHWTPFPASSSLTDISVNLPPAVASTTLLPGIVEQSTTARKFAKGDLRMRATVVYHYKDNPPAQGELNDKPLACVSSYYDPSNASTARNINTGSLPDVSGELTPSPGLGIQQAFIGSNNGITYGPPKARPGASTLSATTGLLSSGQAALDMQANLVFPDGRFANKPLRDALLEADADRNLAEKAAIDSTNCAIQILDGSIVPAPTLIPNGAIQEVAFLNAREVKAIDRDDWTTKVNEAFTLSSPTTAPEKANLTGNYNLPLEEREPLEIRATQINLGVLRGTKAFGDEYLLPNSGIIYATRDDALPDRSFRLGLATGGIDESSSQTVSPTDSRLDPTRKPNGILLVNGKELGRVPGSSATVADVVMEKGLTLASNLPVYIKDEFNLHSDKVEEFQELLDWTTFYDRKKLNNNFACRPNDPRLGGNCTTADTWRPANILSDSITLLSKSYRFGFRNEGDFDLRNNAGAAAVMPRKQQGFYSNNFVTNGLSSGAFKADGNLKAQADPITVKDANYVTTSLPITSSYFNNFVTPVQRRGKFPEYLMEVCNKIPVSACTDADWYVNLLPTPKKADLTITGTDFIAGSGTTAIPPAAELQRFPRRVAFLRTPPTPQTSPPTYPLNTPTTPVPLGISGIGTSATVAASGPGTNLTDNSLWFATTAASGGTTVTYGSNNFPYVFNQALKDGSGADLPQLATEPKWQPLLMPVLQIQTVTEAPVAASSTTLPEGTGVVRATGWITTAENTTFNMVVGSNDTPSRSLTPDVGDFNGGLQNLPRFLESWNSGAVSTKIQGSFIQFGRSAYSTAPYTPIINPAAFKPQQADPKLRSLFDSPPISPSPAPPAVTYTGGVPRALYRTDTGLGSIPFFSPPARNWGYDVGLLSQPPDLFTRKFTTPPSKRNPDEYFREVPRNDEWVETLLCAFLDKDGTTQAVNSSLRPTKFCKEIKADS